MKRAIIASVVLLALLLTSCNNDKFINDYENINKHTDLYDFENTAFFSQNSMFEYTASDVTSNYTSVTYSEDYEIKKYPDDEYLYMEFNGVPSRYNEKTGVLTSYCIDPLCDHYSTECPFWGNIGNCELYNGLIFYIRMSIEKGYDKAYVYYNPETNKVEMLRKGYFGTGIVTMVYYNGYCYYYDLSIDKETEDWTVYLYRQNIETKKIEELDKTDGYNSMILFGYNDKLFFRDTAYGQLYYTPVDNIKDKTIILNSETDDYMYNNEYLYFTETKGSGGKTVSRIAFDGSGYKNFSTDNIWRYYVTDKFIYYMTDETTEIKYSGGTQTALKTARDIWRINKETDTVEKVITLDGALANISIDRFIVSGNYVYASFLMFENDYMYTRSGMGVLRINIETGAWYYISPQSISNGN